MKYKYYFFTIYLTLSYLLFFYFTDLWDNKLGEFFAVNYNALYPVKEGEERNIANIISFFIIPFIPLFSSYFKKQKWLIYFSPLLFTFILFIFTQLYLYSNKLFIHELKYTLKYIYSYLLFIFYLLHFTNALLKKILLINDLRKKK